MISTPAAGFEPIHPTEGGPLAPAAPGRPAIALTRTHRILIGVVGVGAFAIAGIGFAGSYHAVTGLAERKGFGDFAQVFTIGVDVGIGVFLALDLLLTWLRMPYPFLRQGAWLLTAATIAFNAATAWPDPIGVGMHAVIPVLFVIAVEAARHAIGRIADITADKYLEGPKAARWFLSPLATFILWRRQKLWEIRTWDAVLKLERERRIYIAGLRREYGRRWRRKASAQELLTLWLATKNGLSISDAIDIPEQEARRLADEEAAREAEANRRAEAEAEAKRRAEAAEAEAEATRRIKTAEAEAAEAEAKARTEVAQARARAEAEAVAEVARLEVEAKQRAEAEAARLLVAETEAKLAAVAREQEEAEAEAKLNQKRRAAEQARLQEEADRQARERQEEENRRKREEERKERAKRLVADVTTSASAPASASAPKETAASASDPQPAAASASPVPNARARKKAAEVEQLLLRMVEADDPKCISLEDVMTDFGLKQTPAYERLAAARELFARAKETKAAGR